MKRKQRKVEWKEGKRRRRGNNGERKGRSRAEAAGKADCDWCGSEAKCNVGEKSIPMMNF
jgi:hypothetical protein